MVDGLHSRRVPHVALRLLQRRRDDLEVVGHPMLQFAKQVLVGARRVVELQDGFNQPFDQRRQQPRDEQEGRDLEGGAEADNGERETRLDEQKP